MNTQAQPTPTNYMKSSPLLIGDIAYWLRPNLTDILDANGDPVATGVKAVDWKSYDGGLIMTTGRGAANGPVLTDNLINGRAGLDLTKGSTNGKGWIPDSYPVNNVFSGVAGYSISFVCNRTNTGSYSVAMGCGAADTTNRMRLVMPNSSPSIYLTSVRSVAAGSMSVNATNCYTYNVSFIYTAVFDWVNGTAKSYVNNVEVASATTASTGLSSVSNIPSYFPHFDNMQGCIGEYIAYNKALSTLERNSLYQHFVNNWAF